MFKPTDTISLSTQQKAQQKRLLILTMANWLVYVLAVVLTCTLGTISSSPTVLWLLITLTIIVLCSASWNTVKLNNYALDEYFSVLQTKAIVIAFALGSLITFTIGFLQVFGFPVVSWMWCWPIYATCWLGAFLILKTQA